MANRNFNMKQALDKEVKELYAEIGILAGSSTSVPSLGAAATFAVLGASTVTNTGNSVLTGDLGVSPGSAITGFPPGTFSGTLHSADATAAQAQVDATAAYTNLAARPFDTDLTGQDLGGLTLNAGVYKFSSSAGMTGTLTLDAQGNANAVWIFQIGSTLTTASSAVVSIINGGTAGNVFWQVGSSATLGSSTTFKGNIIALASITMVTGSTMVGSAIARTGAVTLDTNNVSVIASNATIAGTPSLTVGLGIKSITRVSAGVYQLLLEDKYMGLRQCNMSIQSATKQNLKYELVSQDVVTAKTINFRTSIGTVETDAVNDCTFRMHIDLKNSSI